MRILFLIFFSTFFGLGLINFRSDGGNNIPQQPANDSIEEQFKNPSRQYGIRCWWWWLNGNVTKESITRDLEEMKAKGFSGACIFDAGGYNQDGNGVVPEGPLFGSAAWKSLYVHAVQEANRLGLVLSLSIQSGWNLGGPDVTPEESTKQITWSELKVNGAAHINQVLPQPESKERFYKDIAVIAFPIKQQTPHAAIRDLSLKTAIKEAGGSAPDTRYLLTDVPTTPGEEDALLNQVIDLNGKTDKNGVLDWEVPSGEWLVMRFGYTATGSKVSTASGNWQGLVIDYMSKEHFNRYWNTHVEPLMKAIGPLAGKSLRYLQTDSWEVGGINWTDKFAEEFHKRRGYDILPYLPVITGKIIQNREVSNRFLADFRKTISDCIAENHYGTFAERAKSYGMGIQPESAGPHAGPLDGLKNYGYSEIVMSEFWSPSPHRPKPDNRFFVKQASSAAHIYNRRLVGAESFTTIGPHWNDVIWADMKPSFDHEICSGLNLVYLHTFTASPKEMGLPGQEYFAGTHFNPNVTWWNWSGAFIKYISRCQYFMQQGQFVADVLYYYGDHVPNIAGQKANDPAKVLPGFDYDVINEDMLQKLSLQNGTVTLPGGMSYKVLVLPNHKALSLAAIKRVDELVKAGATIIGPKPETTISLVSYPGSESELKKIADNLWGNSMDASGINKVGLGRVIWGQTARQVLLADNIQPDFAAKSNDPKQVFDYIHHTLTGMDYYFVSNQNKETVNVTCAFRIESKQPELWDAMTGEIRDAGAFQQKNGQTIIPLELNPYGSVFVIFRKPIPTSKKGISKSNYPAYTYLSTIGGPWELQFDPKWGGPASIKFDSLESWSNRKEEGIQYYSGKVVYRKTFNSPSNIKAKYIYLDLGNVQDVGIARIYLNGKDLGIVWAPPFRVQITGALKQKDNKLEIEVVNSWRNRLVGDRGKPENERFTKTNIRIREEWSLLPAGLLGPVKVLSAE